MKLKCDDGQVREFCISDPSGLEYQDSLCRHCGENFGCHDTHILKPMWKNHVCKTGEKAGINSANVYTLIRFDCEGCGSVEELSVMPKMGDTLKCCTCKAESRVENIEE